METSVLWSTRRQAGTALQTDLKSLSNLLDEVFTVTDQCILRLGGSGTPFGRVCALVVVKAKNLSLGCYSLSLDALAQEAGALFRTLLESIELLTYFRIDPHRIQCGAMISE
jgi:hypothetical protein